VSFKDFTPEQRKAAGVKAAATRRANAALRSGSSRGAAGAGDEIALPEIVYGEILADDPPAPSVEEDTGPYALFLLALDDETKRLLSDAELREIYAAQVAKAFAEKKAAKKKSATEQAAHAARMEAGLVPMAARAEMETAKRNAELVRWTCELPPVGDQGEVADIGLRIDQKIYLHGHTYTIPRAKLDSFREMIYRAGQHELTFKGQNTRQRQWLLGRALGTVDRHIPLNEDGSLA